MLPQLLGCDTVENADPNARSHYNLIKFMQFLDKIFCNPDEFILPFFQQFTSTQKKQFNKKIYRYMFDLFKRPVFDKFDQHSLYSICPNISGNFYRKQLLGLFFRFKDDTAKMSPWVMSDHVESLHNISIASELVPQFHEKVLSLFAKKNDFNSAAEYIRIFNLASNLTTYVNPISNSVSRLARTFMHIISLNF